MEVKDIFKLRKEGKTEEAYNAIIPMYKVHQGHYTTLAMFLVGNDMLQIKLSKGENREAYNIFLSLCNVFLKLEDKNVRTHNIMLNNAIKISKTNENFSMTDFMVSWDINKLTDADWKAIIYEGHPIPSVGDRIISKIFYETQKNPTIEMAEKVAPMVEVAIKHSQNNITNLRLVALLYKIQGHKEKAIEYYKKILKRHRVSYIYAELAEIISNPSEQIALYVMAIITQHGEQFRAKNRIQLAQLLLANGEKKRAAYELNKSIKTRKEGGHHLSAQQIRMYKDLKEIIPTTDSEQNAFYQQEERKMQNMLR